MDHQVTDTVIPISSDADVVCARQQGRALAAQCGFTRSDLALIATAISEVARNIVVYARRGEVIVRTLSGPRGGIEIVARDQGPGIANIGLALQDGFSTSGSLGLGLPGVKRIMDEFEINSVVGHGTTITMRKRMS